MEVNLESLEKNSEFPQVDFEDTRAFGNSLP
jgi:hypothetical protein